MIILASKSPRRQELLASLGVDFTVIPPVMEEEINPLLPVEEIPLSLAVQKAEEVGKNHPNDVIISADTVVVLDGEIMGKPTDESHAIKMLSALSGRTHTVYTGVCVISKNKTCKFTEKTLVEFFPLNREEIIHYVQNHKPLDKAGAYGIQDFGKTFVKGIDGDYYTVMGLPVARLWRVIKDINGC